MHRRLSSMPCDTAVTPLLEEHCSVPIVRRWSHHRARKNAHRGLSVRCSSASGPTRSQAPSAPRKNSPCSTIERRTPLLPQKDPCAGTLVCRLPRDPLCDKPLPGGSTVNQNVNRTAASLYTMQGVGPYSLPLPLAAAHWISNVAPNGPWDYKTSGQPGMEQMGNFNYGATGAVLFSPLTLLSAAGIVQLATLPSNSSGGVPFVSPPYGDEAGDQADIRAGISAGCGG